MTKPYGPTWHDKKSQEEENYYVGAERALRNIRHDSSKNHTPSIETSTPQRRPYNNRDGCRNWLVLLIGLFAGLLGLIRILV